MYKLHIRVIVLSEIRFLIITNTNIKQINDKIYNHFFKKANDSDNCQWYFSFNILPKHCFIICQCVNKNMPLPLNSVNQTSILSN